MFYVRNDSTVRPYRVSISVCNTFLDRLIGALGRGQIPFREGLLFPDCRSIHTFFMRSSIALLFFDHSGNILEYRPKVPPFRMIRGPSESAGVLELAPNRLDAVDETSSGGQLLLEPRVADESGYTKLAHES